MTRLVWFGAAVAAIFTVSSVHAIPLGTLIDTNGMITVGDKQFTNFQLHDVTGQNSTPADPRNLQIDGFTNLLGEHGLRLSPFSVSLPNAESSAALIFSLEYDVTVTDPLFRLHDIRHAFSTTSNRGGGLSLITQAGFPPNVNGSMQSVVGFGGTGALLVDNVNESRNLLNQVSAQHMLNNFEAHAQTVNLTSQGGPVVVGSITTSSIELTFSQTAIPEPATWVLLVSGLMGLIGVRRMAGA
ncbi:MAG: PEP-CTERM sorting domain-containing protein [Nitrospirales bacterium]